ncbi:hypothetical protein LCGC14_0676970 [marine sediment metagenome]|uniref:Uncharacterized protein n=1 Tax=marine sediment metagenome TaxID=412755 RepID=A0A0F9TX72_9ZZZZ
MLEISQPIGEEMIKEGRDNTKQRLLSDPKLNTRYKIGELKNALTYYPDTEFIFNYDEKMGGLHLNLWIGGINMVLNTSIMLSPHDKISILNFINKDNNRIKSQIEEMQHMIKLCEEETTKEHKTDSLKPYCDSITSKDIKDGVVWYYKKDGRVVDTAFMSYKELYEIQIAPKQKICQFCDETHDLEFIRPRKQDSGIYICKQHQKYIQRVSERINGKQDLV